MDGIVTDIVGFCGINWSAMIIETPIIIPIPAPTHGICSSAGKKEDTIKKKDFTKKIKH